LTNDVFTAAHAAGFSKDQVRRAKHRIGAVARKDGFHDDARWPLRLLTAPLKVFSPGPRLAGTPLNGNKCKAY
jgi:hypothetical protein